MRRFTTDSDDVGAARRLDHVRDPMAGRVDRICPLQHGSAEGPQTCDQRRNLLQSRLEGRDERSSLLPRIDRVTDLSNVDQHGIEGGGV